MRRSAASSRPVIAGISMSVTRTSGVRLADGVEGFATVGGLGDDGDVGFEFEQGGEGAEDHGLVFGEDDADGCVGCGS